MKVMNSMNNFYSCTYDDIKKVLAKSKTKERRGIISKMLYLVFE